MTVRCKIFEMLNELADRCFDFFGQYGGSEANPLVRMFRDVRIITIFAGTTEIMKKSSPNPSVFNPHKNAILLDLGELLTTPFILHLTSLEEPRTDGFPLVW